MDNNLELSISDLVVLSNAVQLAQKRGCFEFAESAQLFPVITRVTKYLEDIKRASETMAPPANDNQENAGE